MFLQAKKETNRGEMERRPSLDFWIICCMKNKIKNFIMQQQEDKTIVIPFLKLAFPNL
jgi:hypothetical protein